MYLVANVKNQYLAAHMLYKGRIGQVINNLVVFSSKVPATKMFLAFLCSFWLLETFVAWGCSCLLFWGHRPADLETYFPGAWMVLATGVDVLGFQCAVLALSTGLQVIEAPMCPLINVVFLCLWYEECSKAQNSWGLLLLYTFAWLRALGIFRVSPGLLK